jgi:hypothetical protein
MEQKTRIASGLRGEGAHLSLFDAVAGFPPELMNTAPEFVPYTFWHQLEHIRICQIDILRYVKDPSYESPPWPAGYWPEHGDQATQEQWNQTIQSYREDLESFVSLVTDEETDVLAPVEHNNGRSILGSALIVIDHTAYHLGEFVMGRQMLGAWPSQLE